MYQDSVAGSPREKNQSHLREPWEGRFVLDTKKFCLPLVKILNVPQRYTDFTKAILTLQMVPQMSSLNKIDLYTTYQEYTLCEVRGKYIMMSY